MTTTIHTLPARGISATITNRNPRLRVAGTKFVLFDYKPGFYCSVYSGADIIDALCADIAITGFGGDNVANYPPPANVNGLKTLIGNHVFANNSRYGWIIGAYAYPADVVARATAVARDLLPLLYETSTPPTAELATVSADVATIERAADLGATPAELDDLRAGLLAGEIETGELLADDVDTVSDGALIPTRRNKTQLADALRAVPGRDELPELSERSLKRANLVQLAALAELFDV